MYPGRFLVGSGRVLVGFGRFLVGWPPPVPGVLNFRAKKIEKKSGAKVWASS